MASVYCFRNQADFLSHRQDFRFKLLNIIFIITRGQDNYFRVILHVYYDYAPLIYIDSLYNIPAVIDVEKKLGIDSK